MTGPDGHKVMHSASGRRQLLGVQALRGIGACLVMVAHLIEHELGQTAPTMLTFGGPFGVAIFFVISGFVIHHASGDRPIDPATFAVRRIFRVVPLYWATTLLVAAIGIAAPQIFHTTVLDPGALVKSLLFIPYANPADANDWHPLFKPGWTLNYEMFFYAAVLCLFWCRSALSRAMGLTIVIGGLLLLGATTSNLPGVLAFYARYHLGLFLAGVWVAEAWRMGLFARVEGKLSLVAFPIAALSTLAFYLSRVDIGLMGLASVALMVAALSLEHGPERKMRAISWIGDISYSIYMLHMFVVGAIWAIAHKLMPGAMSAGAMTLVVLAGSAITLVAGGISYRWFEAPVNRMGARLVRRPSGSAGGAARPA